MRRTVSSRKNTLSPLKESSAFTIFRLVTDLVTVNGNISEGEAAKIGDGKKERVEPDLESDSRAQGVYCVGCLGLCCSVGQSGSYRHCVDVSYC